MSNVMTDIATKPMLDWSYHYIKEIRAYVAVVNYFLLLEKQICSERPSETSVCGVVSCPIVR